MLGVFNYVDRIVTQIVRPKKLLFMAVDGVAPRAKLNQQRSRRFRAAKDSQDARREAEQRGEVVNAALLFDSNCITPGTEFMARVSEHLQYFVRKKLRDDPGWQPLEVIFSGAEVPGEGEHKIMQHIRETREAPGSDPNTTHCMYGQDADLIMLSLVTHEPHFTLLREVINFGANRDRGRTGNAVKTVIKQTKTANFQLLHVSVLREYLQIEFCLGKNGTMLPYDLERVVDDYVFLTFLVGNDFLPHLPSLDISENAFDRLFGVYKRSLPAWGPGQYLTDGGEIPNPARLEEFLREV